MNRLGLEEEENIEDKITKNIRNLLQLKKENEVIKDIRNLFERKEEDYYKPVRVGNSRNNNYIECESNGGRNKTLSIEEYLKRIRPYSKNIINDLKILDPWKTN